MNTVNTDEIRAKLETLREEMRAQLIDRRANPDDDSMDESELETQFADAAQASAERDKDLRVIEKVRDQLANVERALQRLDEGNYGSCEDCGESIPEERLEALPYVTRCVSCSQKMAG